MHNSGGGSLYLRFWLRCGPDPGHVRHAVAHALQAEPLRRHRGAVKINDLDETSFIGAAHANGRGV